MNETQKQNIREKFKKSNLYCPCHEGESCECDYLNEIADWWFKEFDTLLSEDRANIKGEIVEMIKNKINKQSRYDCDTDGCGDPECCGSYAVMEENEDGEYIKLSDTISNVGNLLNNLK